MRNKRIDERPIASLTDEERARLILEYERERELLTGEIERVMEELAEELGSNKLTRRKYPLGKSPNDYSSRR